MTRFNTPTLPELKPLSLKLQAPRIPGTGPTTRDILPRLSEPNLPTGDRAKLFGDLARAKELEALAEKRQATLMSRLRQNLEVGDRIDPEFLETQIEGILSLSGDQLDDEIREAQLRRAQQKVIDSIDALELPVKLAHQLGAGIASAAQLAKTGVRSIPALAAGLAVNRDPIVQEAIERTGTAQAVIKHRRRDRDSATGHA